MISPCHDLPYLEKLQYLKLPLLQYQRHRGDLLFLYQMINNYYDINYEIFFFFPMTNVTRGHDTKLLKPTQIISLDVPFFS